MMRDCFAPSPVAALSGSAEHNKGKRKVIVILNTCINIGD